MQESFKRRLSVAHFDWPLLIGARSTLAVGEAGATLTFHVRGRRKRV